MCFPGIYRPLQCFQITWLLGTNSKEVSLFTFIISKKKIPLKINDVYVYFMQKLTEICIHLYSLRSVYRKDLHWNWSIKVYIKKVYSPATGDGFRKTHQRGFHWNAQEIQIRIYLNQIFFTRQNFVNYVYLFSISIFYSALCNNTTYIRHVGPILLNRTEWYAVI